LSRRLMRKPPANVKVWFVFCPEIDRKYEADAACAPDPAGAARGGTGAGRRSAELALGLVDEDQHGHDRHVELEGGILAVPGLRLPHGEPLATDHHEAEEPDQETDGRSRRDAGFRRVEGRGRAVARR